MNLNEYQSRAKQTAVYPGQGELTGLLYAALALAGESGEVSGKVSKILRDDNQQLTDEAKEAIAKELGDVCWTIAAVATELGLSLEDIALFNLDKLSDRKQRQVLNGSGDNR